MDKLLRLKGIIKPYENKFLSLAEELADTQKVLHVGLDVQVKLVNYFLMGGKSKVCPCKCKPG